jgi:predicted nucleic acid-binding protein
VVVEKASTIPASYGGYSNCRTLTARSSRDIIYGNCYKLVEQALSSNRSIISFQVVQDFLHVSVNKFQKPMSIADGQTYLHGVLRPLLGILPDMDFYALELDIYGEGRFSFYDSLIVAAAVWGGCSVLYSEDLKMERVVRGVRIVNPFL